MSPHPTAAELLAGLKSARLRTLALIDGLNAEQLMGPRLPIVNPLRWEIGHVAWFHERWILRHRDGRASLLRDSDLLYDSSTVPHDVRWDLPLPAFGETLRYMQDVYDAVAARLDLRPLTPEDAYFYQLTIFHEDMHTEAFAYMRQTLAYPAPRLAAESAAVSAGALPNDAPVPGGRFLLGAARDQGFVFDNEKWEHVVEVAPFRIARAPVTNSEYAAFIDDGGYRRMDYWDAAGWAWREQARLKAPVYWRLGLTGWEQRRFDQWLPLPPHAPVVHVSWHEAQAYCRWAGRRLPTEAEWEMAAACAPTPDGKGLEPVKRRYPWGDASPTAEHANLDAACGGPIDVAALPAGDSAFGCRQMLGNVWEWTASTFLPYPGFSADPYKDYSEPWFGTRKVLRGGSWATPSRLMWNSWRNFFTPDRNDLYAGFRTCAL
jgi:gamma-glutamyl hercynylcysteine S-oxide synthase